MCLPECQPLTVFWPAPSVYAGGVFSAHFTTRSSCVVYDFLFTWKTAFKNVIISNVIAARTVQQSSREILRCKRLAGIAQFYGIFAPSEVSHRRASGGVRGSSQTVIRRSWRQVHHLSSHVRMRVIHHLPPVLQCGVLTAAGHGDVDVPLRGKPLHRIAD